VLEGVMMKAGNRVVTTCRKEDGSLVVTEDNFDSVRKKKKILDLPLVRGVVNFIEVMALSVKTLKNSADALGIEEEETKFEKWLKEKLKINSTDFAMGIALVLGLGLSLLLFLGLPIFITWGINAIITSLGGAPMDDVLKSVIEGLVKVGIFLGYLSLVSLMPEIKRTFMYHGAEHKSIACYEAGEELTPENAMKQKRFHPRCGTSFMFLMILIGIVAGICIRLAIPNVETWLYTLIRLAILPILMGLGYEIILLAGKHDNWFTRAISAPGLWVQRITTKEPTLDMLEVAIVSIKGALRDEDPDFMEYWEKRGWEPEAEADPLLENDTAEFSEVAEGIETEDEASENSDGKKQYICKDVKHERYSVEYRNPIHQPP
jgi:uncharacterized protein YqhQ